MRFGDGADASTRATPDISSASLSVGAARRVFSSGPRTKVPLTLQGLQRVTITGVPTLTRSKRSVMSWLYIRMQPYET